VIPQKMLSSSGPKFNSEENAKIGLVFVVCSLYRREILDIKSSVYLKNGMCGWK